MKNIFLIPTDKETNLIRVWNDVEKTKFALKVGGEVNDTFKEYVNVYITSDEVIKKENWFIDLNYNKIFKNDLLELNIINSKKIVLTNDTSLIEDGVQAVDSLFLSFFAENTPDYVEVSSERIDGSYCDETDTYKYKYYTVFSQKETKQEYSDSYNEKDDELLNKTVSKYLKEKQKEHLIKIMKSDEELGLYEQTAEEETLAKIKFVLFCNNDAQAIRLLEQYREWIEENLYTKEDVKEAFSDGWMLRDGALPFPKAKKKWFNKFKKK